MALQINALNWMLAALGIALPFAVILLLMLSVGRKRQ